MMHSPQNQWEQLAWQGIRKRSWQTEQTSSSGGTGDADEEAAAEELIPFLPSFPVAVALGDAREGTRHTRFCFRFPFTVK